MFPKEPTNIAFTLQQFDPDSPYLDSPEGELRVVEFKIGGWNKYPHVSFTVDVYEGKHKRDHKCVACGQLNDVIDKYFPEVAVVRKWHLWDIRGSMHYVNNALFWLGQCGWHKSQDDIDNTRYSYGPTVPSLDTFRRHVLWGELESDRAIPREWYTFRYPYKESWGGVPKIRTQIELRLMERLPTLRTLMYTELGAFVQQFGGIRAKEVISALNTLRPDTDNG